MVLFVVFSAELGPGVGKAYSLRIMISQSQSSLGLLTEPRICENDQERQTKRRTTGDNRKQMLNGKGGR